MVVTAKVFFLFFKQKTAYEMRISDWSSDVCSSDLGGELVVGDLAGNLRVGLQELQEVAFAAPDFHRVALHEAVGVLAADAGLGQRQQHALRMHQAAAAVEVLLHGVGVDQRSEVGRVGKECVRTCIYRGRRSPEKKK